MGIWPKLVKVSRLSAVEEDLHVLRLGGLRQDERYWAFKLAAASPSPPSLDIAMLGRVERNRKENMKFSTQELVQQLKTRPLLKAHLWGTREFVQFENRKWNTSFKQTKFEQMRKEKFQKGWEPKRVRDIPQSDWWWRTAGGKWIVCWASALCQDYNIVSSLTLTLRYVCKNLPLTLEHADFFHVFCFLFY